MGVTTATLVYTLLDVCGKAPHCRPVRFRLQDAEPDDRAGAAVSGHRGRRAPEPQRRGRGRRRPGTATCRPAPQPTLHAAAARAGRYCHLPADPATDTARRRRWHGVETGPARGTNRALTAGRFCCCQTMAVKRFRVGRQSLGERFGAGGLQTMLVPLLVMTVVVSCWCWCSLFLCMAW